MDGRSERRKRLKPFCGLLQSWPMPVSGIVSADRAAKVVKRLMAPDMWSGSGIRTLSTDNPSYNPNSYQNGAVWPH